MARVGVRSSVERVPFAEARSLGHRLRQRRVRLGLSQRDIARRLLISPPAVHNHETGVGWRSEFRRHDEILTQLEREASPEVRESALPRIPRIPQPGPKYHKPRTRSRAAEVQSDANPPKPADYPRTFLWPPAGAGDAILWPCAPLEARITEGQCAANRHRARRPRGEIAKLVAKRAPVTAARMEGLEPCLTCLGVRERARRTGQGPVAFRPLARPS